MSRALNLVCDRAVWDFVMEGYFIREVLLSGLQRPVRVFPLEADQNLPVRNDLLVVSLYNAMEPFINRVIQSGAKNVGVFHMGDEVFGLNRSFYAKVDYVIRNYFHPDALVLPSPSRSLGVLWVPNGYRHGIGARSSQTLTPFTDRYHVMFFSGQSNPGLQGQRDRALMIDVIRQNQLPGVAILTDRFAAGLGPASYAAIIKNSRFALVPRGHAEETIRLFDAMELGAIPVSLRHNFLIDPRAMGGAPVVMLDDWEQLPQWLSEMALKPGAQDAWRAHQGRLIDWWSSFKVRMRSQVTELIERSFARYPDM